MRQFKSQQNELIVFFSRDAGKKGRRGTSVHGREIKQQQKHEKCIGPQQWIDYAEAKRVKLNNQKIAHSMHKNMCPIVDELFPLV